MAGLAWGCASLGPATAGRPGRGEDPAEALALVAQAQMRLAAGEVADGLKLFRRATELDPDNSELAEEFGLALAESGMGEEAAKQLGRVTGLSASGEATLGMLLAQAAQAPADLETAVSHLKKGTDAVSQGAQARLVLAQSLVRLGHGPEAWEQVKAMLDEHPNDPRLDVLAGQALREMGKYDEAVAHLERAAGNPEVRQRATLELVETLARAGKFKQAADLFGDFLNKEGSTLAGLTRWATLLARAGERARAREVLDKVLAGDPTQREAMLLKAVLEAGDGQLDSAERLYRKALAAQPQDPDATLGLARLLMDARRLDEARTLLDGLWGHIEENKLDGEEPGREVAQERTALELLDHKAEAALPWLRRCGSSPLGRRTLALWGEYFRRREAFGEGVAFLRDAKIGEDKEELRLRRALQVEFGLAVGDEATARPILEALLAGDEDDVTAALGALERRKRYSETVTRAREALTRFREAGAVQFALAAALERAGAWDDAVKEFRALLARQPDNAASLNYLGYMFADRGVNLDEAREMLTKAVKLDPTSGAFQDSLGWVYFRLGEFDRAEKYLVEALRLEPFDATVNEHVGDLMRVRGEKTKAASAYRQALANDPEEEGQKERIAKKLAEVEGAAGP